MAAYLIADVEVTNPEGYEEYRAKVPAVIAAYGGRYLVRGGACEVLEGGGRTRRRVVLEFPTMAQLKAFWESPEYRPLRALRERNADSHIVAVEGVPDRRDDRARADERGRVRGLRRRVGSRVRRAVGKASALGPVERDNVARGHLRRRLRRMPRRHEDCPAPHASRCMVHDGGERPWPIAINDFGPRRQRGRRSVRARQEASGTTRQPRAASQPPYFASVQSSLPYPEPTLNLKADLMTQPVGQRPKVILQATDHPLYREQKFGITPERVQEIVEAILHRP